MSKTFLVAFDYSKESDAATEYAILAAKDIGAKVVMFHLHNISIHAANARFAPFSISDAVDNYRQQTLKHCKKLEEIHGFKLTLAWATGNFHEEIKRVIEEHQVTVVFMGMPRKSLEQQMLGNTTTSAITKLLVPVLAVPSNIKYQGVKKILFACDLDSGVEGELLKGVREVAVSFGAKLVVFHVQKKISDLKQAPEQGVIDAIFDDGLEGVTYRYKNVSSNAVLQAIQDAVRSTEADLLIMAPQKHGFWSSFVHRSKTRIMASHSEVPLLSIRLH